MSEKAYDYIKITDLKDMLNKTKDMYFNKPAYKIKNSDGNYIIITHDELRNMIDALGTALINLGLKGKRIAVIGKNRYEWGIAYLSIVCGTGVVVPIDKSLPENELASVIERAEVEAVLYDKKHEESLVKIKNDKNNKLKILISMDLEEHTENKYSQNQLIKDGIKLIKDGNREFIDSKINPEEMSIMLFTSGTTSQSKVVMLSHKNICSNLMDLSSTLDVNSDDIFLSVLPIHHVFECTVGFQFALYKGAQITFGNIKHVLNNLNEYKATVMACVPGVFEAMYGIIKKRIEKQDTTKVVDMFGGQIKLFISGAAALDSKVEKWYRECGINLVQGYGLTETSPVIGIGSNENYKTGSVGKPVPSIEAKLANVNSDGIGELIVKGPTVMLGYYGNEKATAEAIKDEWFYTGDLAKIDDEGYIFICGRKKNVIVLKNGKNIFPEEMELLVNKIDGVKESMIFGKQKSEDKDDIKINALVVFDREKMQEIYNVNTDEQIYQILSENIKEINKIMPNYKAIRGITITEMPLIKTTTNKIKRQANLEAMKIKKNIM